MSWNNCDDLPSSNLKIGGFLTKSVVSLPVRQDTYEAWGLEGLLSVC